MRLNLRYIAYSFFLGLLVLPTSRLLAQTVISGTPWDAGMVNAKAAGLPDQTIYNIISSTLQWMLAILGFIAIIAFVISGLLYLTAAGDEGQAEQAKNAMKYAIIGVIVALVGYVAIQAIDGILSASTTF